MELELGLALPDQYSRKGFDLNKTHWTFKPKDQKVVMNNPWSLGPCLEAKRQVLSKRSYDEAFGETKDESSPLVWNGQPNGEDDRHGKKENLSCTVNIKGHNEEGNQVVGWPPIKSWRKKLMQQHLGYRSIENNCHRPAEKEHQAENTTYVKVKMEGVTIVRKVDLRLYSSYEMLKSALIPMFAKFFTLKSKFSDAKDESRHENSTLTYLDKEGNWLLAGDVPWQIFMDSVQE